jgi:hypothetical protein
MRVLIASLLAMGAAACAAAPLAMPAGASRGGQAADRPVTELPPQALAEGACGLFLFERRPPNRFVLFEDLASRSVQIVHEGEIFTLGVTEQRGALVTGEAFRRIYLDPRRNITFTLTGEVGEETGSGPRLQDVLLTVQALDGGRVVRPLGGVRSCNEDGA